MKLLFAIFIIVILNLSTIFAQEKTIATKEDLQKWIALEKDETRAKKDDQVLIVVVKVKEESKDEFDSWIKNILYYALNNSNSDMKKAQLKATRWLEPISQNKDKTWTYSWIMDPMIPNTNYDIEIFLIKEYGENEGKAHWQKYLTFMADQPQSFMLKQTDY